METTQRVCGWLIHDSCWIDETDHCLFLFHSVVLLSEKAALFCLDAHRDAIVIF